MPVAILPYKSAQDKTRDWLAIQKRRSTRSHFNKVFHHIGSPSSSAFGSTSGSRAHGRSSYSDVSPALEVEEGKFQPDWAEANRTWIFGQVLDPRSRMIQGWNKLFLLACALGTAIDPLFLYLLSVNLHMSCLFMERGFAIMVTALRAGNDLMYVCHMWLQLKLAFVSKESLVLGKGQLVWDARKVALNYVLTCQAFLFDVFVILPIPQVVLWVVVPHLIRKGRTTTVLLAVVLTAYLFQYLPKVLHLIIVIKRMQNVTGYVFGTAWWGFALNLIAYFIAAHITGALWYFLMINQVETCILQRCQQLASNCSVVYLGCPWSIADNFQPIGDLRRMNFGQDSWVQAQCVRAGGRFNFGVYHSAVPLASETSWTERILYPLFWGLMTLSTFGNSLQPSNHKLEVLFSIIVILCGLILFMLLIGNIQVFLHSITARKEMMQLRIKDMEWWMKRRQLPPRLRQRVRLNERQRWAATRGVDELSMVSDLPEGLRRDIKRHLCLDLVRQVPLFEQMDDLVLNCVCDRLRPLLFIKGETVMREGEPVLRMLFLARGHLQSTYRLSNNVSSVCVLGPGNFCGDELISWCLRNPPIPHLPPSTATNTSLDTCEVFVLEADDLKFVTQHFRYKFEDEQMKRTVRFYSFSWRMWAAVTIQLAWRRYKTHRADTALAASGTPQKHAMFAVPDRSLTRAASEIAINKDRLRMYTAMILSPKPQDNVKK